MDKQNITGQIHNAMYQNIKKKGYAAPVDVLMDIGVLSKRDYENWRFGKVDFLERVCRANLRVLSSIMKEIRAYAVKNHLKPSWTCYLQWGKNKDRRLQFSKSKDDKNGSQWNSLSGRMVWSMCPFYCSNTIREATWDGRYSGDVRAWANRYPTIQQLLVERKEPMLFSALYLNEHTIILNQVALIAMQKEKELAYPKRKEPER